MFRITKENRHFFFFKIYLTTLAPAFLVLPSSIQLRFDRCARTIAVPGDFERQEVLHVPAPPGGQHGHRNAGGGRERGVAHGDHQRGTLISDRSADQLSLIIV